MKIPKKYQKISDHYAECDNEEHCLVCGDIIGFALERLRIEKELPYYKNLMPWQRPTFPFLKFLKSTLPKGVCRCPRAKFSREDIVDFAKWLQKLRSHEFLAYALYCHAEFRPK